MSINDRQSLAITRHCGTKLRALGITDPHDFHPHSLDWGDLNKRQSGIATIARSLIEKLEAAGEDEQPGLSQAHDGLMALWDSCETEKDIRGQLAQRCARDSSGSPFRPSMGGGIAYGVDSPNSGWLDGDELRGESYALKPEERMEDRVRARGCDSDPRVSPGAYLRAMVIGPQNEAERRALSEGTDSAGGYTVPDLLSARLIDKLRAKSVLVAAGAKTIPLGSDQNYVAKVLTDPVPAWRAENAAVDESGPTFTRIAMAPKSLAVLCKVSRELLEDSLNIETELPRILAEAMAVEVDRMGMFGSGSGAEPQGLVNMSGIGTVALSAVLSGYAPLVTARTQILTANAPEPTAYIMHPREDGTLTGKLDGNGQPIVAPPKIAAIRQLVTTAIPTNGGVGTNESSIIAGHFPHFLIGLRSELRIEILKERFADNLQYGFLAHMRVCVAVENAGSFSVITGVKP